VRFDMETSVKATPPSRVLTRYQADEEPRLAGNRAAQAYKELLRIGGVPTELMAQVDLASGDVEPSRRFAAFGHYARIAHTKRRRQALGARTSLLKIIL
jgi:hypothetical protein